VLRAVFFALEIANRVREARNQQSRRPGFDAGPEFRGGASFFDEDELERLRRRRAGENENQAGPHSNAWNGAADDEKDISDRVRILEEKRPDGR